VRTESDWTDLVVQAYQEISPRGSSANITVHSIEIVDDDTCIADVNPAGSAGSVERIESVTVNDESVTLKEVDGEIGIGEQRVEVRVGY